MGSIEAVTTLYRPVGQAEVDLIRESGFREFPPRLSEQPISIRCLMRSMRHRLLVIGIQKMSGLDLLVTSCGFNYVASF